MYVQFVDLVFLISDVIVICSGRWSEPRDVLVDNWQVGRQSKQARERSGDVQLDSLTRVGVFSFRIPSSESLIHCTVLWTSSKLGVAFIFVLLVNFVSWMTEMSMPCFSRLWSNSLCLPVIPFMFMWTILNSLVECEDTGGGGGEPPFQSAGVQPLQPAWQPPPLQLPCQQHLLQKSKQRPLQPS